MTTRTVHRFDVYPAVPSFARPAMPPVWWLVAFVVYLAVLVGSIARGPVVVQEVAAYGP